MNMFVSVPPAVLHIVPTACDVICINKFSNLAARRALFSLGIATICRIYLIGTRPSGSVSQPMGFQSVFKYHPGNAPKRHNHAESGPDAAHATSIHKARSAQAFPTTHLSNPGAELQDHPAS